MIRFSVNGVPTELSVPPGRRLLDVLREDLRLTGTKEGCGEGECGACAVLVDGALVNSCLVPAIQVEGKEIQTVEGLSEDELSPLQRAFLESGAAQCGICTPGMLMASQAFLHLACEPTSERVREALSGNLCRCTGYEHIVRAVQRVTKEAP